MAPKLLVCRLSVCVEVVLVLVVAAGIGESLLSMT
jgi:hypothetical protein